MKIQVFWDMTPCRLVSSYRRFGCSFFNSRSWPLGSGLFCQPVTAKRWEFLLYALLHILEYLYLHCGPGSSVGIATELRSGRSGIESRLGRDFPPVQTGPGAHPSSCTMGTGSFPGVKSGQGMLLTTHPLLVQRSWKSRAIPLPPSGPHLTCNGITLPFLFVSSLAAHGDPVG